MQRRVQLQVEQLGERIMLSAPPVTLPTKPLPMIPAPALLAQHRHLQGIGRGIFTREFADPSAGAHFHLDGTGSFNYLGRVKITGDLQSGGLTLQNHVRGTITLVNARGSVTLAVRATTRTVFGTLPTWLRYSVVSSTGAYAHLSDYGALMLTKRYTIPEGGTFRMTIA
jgi:hypothetical protein